MYNDKLITLSNPKSPIAEAYRIIRTNVQFSCLDEQLKKLLVTSSIPGEGKSVTSANLAATFAQTGRKVILLDADLRKPSQHKLFELPNQTGLTNILLGDVNIKEALSPTTEKYLSVITTGPIPPNPAEMLGSKRMEEFLLDIENYCDLIVIDTPPVISVTDAALLASKADAVLLVVASNQARIDAAKKAKELLLNAKANIVGTVLNMVEENSEDYYYYYYYGNYGQKGKNKKSRRGVASL